MPILRKIIRWASNGAYLVSVPKSWLDEIEARLGRQIEKVSMEVNEVITIKPYIPPEEPPKKEEVKTKPIEVEPEEIF
jgi:hypothetical protein